VAEVAPALAPALARLDPAVIDVVPVLPALPLAPPEDAVFPAVAWVLLLPPVSPVLEVALVPPGPTLLLPPSAFVLDDGAPALPPLCDPAALLAMVPACLLPPEAPVLPPPS
jgi:hypothetical protein